MKTKLINLHSDSSFIKAIGTTPKKRDLYVAMRNGSLYKYFGAGKHFENMMAAKSAGNYLNEEIKSFHKCMKKGGA